MARDAYEHVRTLWIARTPSEMKMISPLLHPWEELTDRQQASYRDLVDYIWTRLFEYGRPKEENDGSIG